MYGCTTSSPLDCLTQKKPDGSEIFPNVTANEFSKEWAREGTMRILHKNTRGSSYWSRYSPDGRLLAGGAFFVDMKPVLRGEPERYVKISASYDPSFMPDNSAFMIQGGGKVCPVSVMTNASLTEMTMNEPGCSSLDAVSLYQSLGAHLDNNELSDHFYVNNEYQSDDGGNGNTDSVPSSGETQQMEVHVTSLVDGLYKVKQTLRLPACTWNTMMSPTTKALASRVAGEGGQLGYKIQLLKSELGAEGYAMQLKDVGRICMNGTKAQFSFDERLPRHAPLLDPRGLRVGCRVGALRIERSVKSLHRRPPHGRAIADHPHEARSIRAV